MSLVFFDPILTKFCVMLYLTPSTLRTFQHQAATNPLSDCLGQLNILLGNQKFKVLCPNGQLKSKELQETECELNFVIIFYILTDVDDILFQNRLKVDSYSFTSFVGSMSQREGVVRFDKQFFSIIKC